MKNIDLNLQIAVLIKKTHSTTKCKDEKEFLEQLADLLKVKL